VADRTEKLTVRTEELTQLTEELEARTQQLAALNEVAVALSRCQTTDEVMSTGLSMAVRLTGCRAGAAWVKSGVGAAIDWYEGSSEEEAKLRELVGAYLEREGLEMRRCTFVPAGSQALLVVPLVSRLAVLGGLVLLVEEPSCLGRTELQLEESLGAQVGVALENARQYEDARYLAERDSVTGLLNHRALHSRLEKEFARVRRSGRKFSLLMLDLDNFKLFNDTYGHPVGDDILRRVGAVITEAVRATDDVGRYGGDEFMVVLPETDTQGAVELAERLLRLLHDNPFVGREGLEVPILASCGVATYPDDAVLLHELIGAADSHLYRSKEEGGDRITSNRAGERGEAAPQGNFSVLEGLVTAVDRKDRYTRHHSEDVTEWALAIAGDMGLSEESRRTLRIAGLLHDVGKIGVPDSILRKPGRLTEAEFEVVKQHALLSELIIKEVPNLMEVMAAVGSHHERFDGLGYPRNLKGTDIPLFGRILAVADAYSAMTTDRPYRKAMSHEEARTELERVAGTQLDPGIVEVFLRLTADLASIGTLEEAGRA
jgi:diguanylate cyclase (GGDEF)-like protein